LPSNNGRNLRCEKRGENFGAFAVLLAKGYAAQVADKFWNSKKIGFAKDEFREGKIAFCLNRRAKSCYGAAQKWFGKQSAIPRSFAR
jgi:hypothetical protein